MSAQSELSKLRAELVALGKQRLAVEERKAEDLSRLQMMELSLLEANQKISKLAGMPASDRAEAYKVLGGEAGHMALLEQAYKEITEDKARKAERALQVETELRDLASRVIAEGESANKALLAVEQQLAEQTAARVAAEDASARDKKALALAEEALQEAQQTASECRMELDATIPKAKAAVEKAEGQVSLLQRSNALTVEMGEAAQAEAGSSMLAPACLATGTFNRQDARGWAGIMYPEQSNGSMAHESSRIMAGFEVSSAHSAEAASWSFRVTQ